MKAQKAKYDKANRYRKNQRSRIKYATKNSIGAYYTLLKRFQHWKTNAKKRHIEWILDFKDLESMPQKCFYTGVDLTLVTQQPNTISLDRLDSTKGYTVDNVVFCCSDINFMKQEFSVDKFLFLCQSVCDYKAKATTFWVVAWGRRVFLFSNQPQAIRNRPHYLGWFHLYCRLWSGRTLLASDVALFCLHVYLITFL